ncbi:hypothetical protein KC365_g16176 [Hortaea werneckii]|nr:hypothetical protein KC323_g9317 [Hortaea werneckii]KAI7208217.1 hypothetical protein KC365_g16176 [Hortaea werneckii]
MDIKSEGSKAENTYMTNAEIDYKPNAADDEPLLFDSRSEEEMLPLYTESHIHREADDPMKAPNEDATPDQVRDFIFELLTTKRNLHVDHARRIAAKWTIGNGKEMRTYPPSIYGDIFGFENGWIVYKEVHVALCMAIRKKSRGKVVGIRGIVLFAIWFLAAGLLIGLTDTFLYAGVVMIIIGCFPLILMGMAFVYLLLFGLTKLENLNTKLEEDADAIAQATAQARIEARLLAAFKNRPSPTNRC